MNSIPVLQIALPLPLYQNFEYLAPSNLEHDTIKIGTRARVVFGKRKLTGIIVKKNCLSSLPRNKLKTVSEILDVDTVFEPTLLKLLDWAAAYYHQPLGEVLNTALPSALRKGKYISLPKKILYQVIDTENYNNNFTKAPKQKMLADLLRANPEGLYSKQISQHIPNWRPPIKALIEKGIVKKTQVDTNSLQTSSHLPSSGITLNEEQQSAYTAIHKQLKKYNTHLLAGVTGSGKTEVYLALARDIINSNKQVAVLVPEIGLTEQLAQRIQSRLNLTATQMHSGLNETERAQAWLAAKTGRAKIIIGTRSAVFLAYKDLGLIIVDEEHDLSFKQQEGFLYHARDIAIYRAKQLGIPIVLGSATPSFETQHNVSLGRYQKQVLRKRAKEMKAPQIKLVDLRSKHVIDGLSNELIDAMKTELENNHQVLLFLNRRGYAPTILCHNCGWIAECSRCDARMTFYKKTNTVKCHYCQKENSAPDQCPQCNTASLIWLGEGTQRIETKLQEIFPEVAITRIDRDSTRKKNELQSKLCDIHNKKYQIIIGTQMLSKGHDFPGVTLVGILNVDHGLYSTDFRATERLAQLITQVAGRAGRNKNNGKVLLQTYQPEHPLLNCLLSNGYMAFSAEALVIRKSCGLPPYTNMILLRARAHQQHLTKKFLHNVKDSVISNKDSNLNILGPIPASIEKKAGMYQSQLVVIASSRKAMRKHSAKWIHKIQQLALAKRVRWTIEVDPLEME